MTGPEPEHSTLRRATLAAALLVASALGLTPTPGRAQEFAPGPYPSAMTPDTLVRMSPEGLDSLYRSAEAGCVLRGKVSGRVIISPGKKRTVPTSRAARLWWQGKVFRDDGTTAINRFMGVPIVEGSLYYAPSWVDGRPSLILDYEHTSRVYRNVRDEIRQVAPNLYLGAMYERTQPKPTLKMYFVLETRPCP